MTSIKSLGFDIAKGKRIRRWLGLVDSHVASKDIPADNGEQNISKSPSSRQVTKVEDKEEYPQYLANMLPCAYSSAKKRKGKGRKKKEYHIPIIESKLIISGASLWTAWDSQGVCLFKCHYNGDKRQETAPRDSDKHISESKSGEWSGNGAFGIRGPS
ncbi:predicted protein [Histoplasma capsulatum var. duboisii H88]|uniref:Predicted protein n=2 Tax=Ajellomyces capsulatus TaxID=5037 RepID=F0U6E1_AJEC8|nr:predicted protein [Histoplasma capsulatum H143]EGC41477.1 predicted protein [Histoplasma capsulatum var. duboisii H88]